MRGCCAGVCFFAVLNFASWAAVAEPEDKQDIPFWQLPSVELELRKLSPAPVVLVAAPDMRRGLVLLQTGDDIPPINFVPSNPELLPFLPPQDSGYQVVPKGLKIGAAPFGDRKYLLDKLPPEFAGLTLLQTKMGHKAVLDGRYAIVVSSAKPCLIFIAMDERALETYKQHGAPAWLQEYSPTGHKIKSDEPIMAQTGSEYLVFVRKSPGGRIVLGPPAMDIQFNSMYFAFFGDAQSDDRKDESK